MHEQIKIKELAIAEEKANNWEDNEVILWGFLVAQYRQLFIAMELFKNRIIK
jgi:hypothetical protein